MLHFDDIVFGPIASRRLGASLGVNILPSKGKLCNFDCVYCECGWNADGAQDRTLPTFEQVKAALDERIPALAAEGVRIDSITFSGNGEPTVHPDFPQIMDEVILLRDRYCPDAKVSVLSNAALVVRPQVREALRKSDNPILKIDGPDDEMIAAVNKPVGTYRLKDILEGLKLFEGNFILQTMFVKSPDFDMSSPDVISAWRDIVRLLKPREVMVYTIDRETPDGRLGKYTVEQMAELVQPLVDEGYKIQIRG